MTTALVTGATGFIGKFLVDFLHKAANGKIYFVADKKPLPEISHDYRAQQ